MTTWTSSRIWSVCGGREGGSLVALSPYLVYLHLSQVGGVRIKLNCRTPIWCSRGAWCVGKLHVWGPQWSGVRAEGTHTRVLFLYIHSANKMNSLKTETPVHYTSQIKDFKRRTRGILMGWKHNRTSDHLGSRCHCWVTLASHLASLGICDFIFNIKK